MKWFFALNEYGNEFEEYCKLLKVAVCSAQENTSLEPVFLYDGQSNHLTSWIDARGIRIIHCRSMMYEKLEAFSRSQSNNDFLSIGGGAFLRTEIPKITLDHSMPDKFVLYTDLDVMFLSDVVQDFSLLHPKYFAVAPESKITNYKKMNSGVMIMNLSSLRKVDKQFRRYLLENADDLFIRSWDQTAYQIFFRGLFGTFKWNKLSPVYNWKPYWGQNDSAKIIHFHGPKPYQKTLLDRKETAAHLLPLLKYRGSSYDYFCSIWEDFLRKAA
jgi:hypothetical protein